MLTVKTFVEGPIDANNYLVIEQNSQEAVLIDCSSDRKEFIQAIKDLGCKLKYILLTHGHFDHVMGVETFKKEFGVDVYMAKEDLTQIDFVPQMLKMFTGAMSNLKPEIANFVKDGDEFQIGDTVIKAISTAGHTKGSMCYYTEDKLFSGDTLFKGSCGRCDMFEGDLASIVKNIKEKLFTLPNETVVYTGHGEGTTINYEKQYNEILNL